MKREKTRAILVVLIFVLMCCILDCQVGPTSPEEPTTTATAIFIPTATATPASTSTPISPTPTYTPVPAATPTTTPTPRPTNTSSPTPTPSVVLYERAPIFKVGVVVDTSARRIPETEIRQLFAETADLFRDRVLPAISVQGIEYIDRREAVVSADVPPKSDQVLMLIYLLKHQQNPPDAIVIFSRSSRQLSKEDAARYGISTIGAYNIRPLGISNYTSRFRSPNYSDAIFASLMDLDVSYIRERKSWYLAHELLHPFGEDFFKVNPNTNKIDIDADHYDHPNCAGRMPGIVPRGNARFLDEYNRNFGFCPDVLTNFRKSPFGEQGLVQQQVDTPTPTSVPAIGIKPSPKSPSPAKESLIGLIQGYGDVVVIDSDMWTIPRLQFLGEILTQLYQYPAVVDRLRKTSLPYGPLRISYSKEGRTPRGDKLHDGCQTFYYNYYDGSERGIVLCDETTTPNWDFIYLRWSLAHEIGHGVQCSKSPCGKTAVLYTDEMQRFMRDIGWQVIGNREDVLRVRVEDARFQYTGTESPPLKADGQCISDPLEDYAHAFASRLVGGWNDQPVRREWMIRNVFLK